ncbi:hypothetical protein MNBD_GAMMA16-1351 [hydrothermal vent metagenome]|uniref:SPOR domain-containing protein n=1 Tax=hydrothermal vent metagenome TaxID=652676 RepID=A0A3B0YUZ2_9ZZZZ
MTKDYKPNPEKKSTPAPGWAWLLAGLLIGLFIGFLIYLDKAVPVPEKKTASHQTETEIQPQAPQQPESTDLVEKPENEVPRFSFYQELPRMVIEVPALEPESSPKVTKTEVTTQRTSHKPQPNQSTYILQIGSFRHHREADRLKARLAFMGLQAKMQPVTVNNNQKWIRVRVGPFSSFKQAEQIQARLKRNKIATILLKLSG